MRSLAVAIALLAVSAHAGWNSTTVSGTPRDVVVVDAGVCVVATTNPGGGAFVYDTVDGGPALGNSFAGNFISAMRRGNCLIGVTVGVGTMGFDSACGGSGYTLANGNGRLRGSTAGTLYLSATTNVGALRVYRLDVGTSLFPSTNWVTVPISPGTATTTLPLSVLSTATNNEWVACSREATTDLYFSRDSIPRLVAPMARGIHDVALFEAVLGTVGAVVASDAGELLVSPNILQPDGGFFTVQMPVQPFTSVAFSASAGTQFGRGFGMATAGTQVFSPVPNPNALGAVWVPRSGAPNGLTRISCFDPTYCAGIVSSAGPGANLWVYVNASAPSASGGTVNLAAGASTSYFLDAGDNDGDPLWITWDGGSVYWDGGDPRFVTLTAPGSGTCSGGILAQVSAVLSDGYGPHDTVVPVTIMGMGSGPGQPPVVAPSTGLTFVAGGTSQAAFASFPDAGCSAGPFTWSLVPRLGMGLDPDGGEVVVTPPATYCSPTAGQALLTAASSAGNATVPVVLKPWGDPFDPAFASPFTQLAGTSVGYAPDASTEHACQATAGYPGTRLLWQVDAGGLSGVTFFPTNSNLRLVSSDACARGAVTAKAVREVNGISPAQQSGESSLLVKLIPNWTPISAATPFDTSNFAYDPTTTIASGAFTVSTNCVNDRLLTARVEISVKDGGPVGSVQVPVTGPWSTSVDGGCAGGTFSYTATLFDETGDAGPSVTHEFTTQLVKPQLPTLATQDVAVTCETGARGTLQIPLTQNDCKAAAFSWTQTGGPTLVDAPSGGSTVSFATASHDLQAQAGTELTWQVRETIGGLSDLAIQRVRLVPAPFIRASHRSQLPIAREEEAISVELTLSNESDCSVSGLVVRELLGGNKPIDGTVSLDGRPLVSRIVDGVIEIPSLALPARGSVKVTYSARVPLLAHARPSTAVEFRGADVTLGARPVAPTGCGCDSSGGGVVALFALLGLARRRRSKPAANF